MQKLCFQGNNSEGKRWIILRNENGHIKVIAPKSRFKSSLRKVSVGWTHLAKKKKVGLSIAVSSNSHFYLCVLKFASMEEVVSLSSPSCLRAPSPIQLLHAVSHRCIPSEDRERSSRLLLVPRNMKRPMQWVGLAANEQTVGGWLLPHTSAAGGPTGGKRHRGRERWIATIYFF